MPESVPRYQEIAAAFAEKLVNGEYREGDRVFSRSTLASTYSVSAETARRAMAVLADLGVLEILPGSGAVILSVDKAVEFLHFFRQKSYVETLRQELTDSIRRQRAELDHFAATLEDVSHRVTRYRQENPFVPFRCVVSAESPRAGRTLEDVNFWHHTGATVVAIRTGEHTVLSPGPHAELTAGSTVFFVGEPDCVSRVHAFLDGAPPGQP